MLARRWTRGRLVVRSSVMTEFIDYGQMCDDKRAAAVVCSGQHVMHVLPTSSLEWRLWERGTPTVTVAMTVTTVTTTVTIAPPQLASSCSDCMPQDATVHTWGGAVQT